MEITYFLVINTDTFLTWKPTSCKYGIVGMQEYMNKTLNITLNKLQKLNVLSVYKNSNRKKMGCNQWKTLSRMAKTAYH